MRSALAMGALLSAKTQAWEVGASGSGSEADRVGPCEVAMMAAGAAPTAWGWYRRIYAGDGTRASELDRWLAEKVSEIAREGRWHGKGRPRVNGPRKSDPRILRMMELAVLEELHPRLVANEEERCARLGIGRSAWYRMWRTRYWAIQELIRREVEEVVRTMVGRMV